MRTWTSVSNGGAEPITDTSYRYDALGRLIEVKVTGRNDAGPFAPEDQEITQYRFDANGNLDLEKRPGNITTDYVYDALNRLRVLENFVDTDEDGAFDTGETLLGKYEYDLYEDGKRKKVTETDDLGNTTTIDWVYDELGRLTEERYDSFDNTIDYIARYGFDLANNRLKLTKDVGTPRPPVF